MKHINQKKIIIFLLVIIIGLIITLVIVKKDKPEEDKSKTPVIEDKIYNNIKVEKFNKDFKSYNFKKEGNTYTAINIKLDELFSAFFYEFYDKEYIYSEYFYNEEINQHFYGFRNKEKKDIMKTISIKEETDKFIVEILD